jgi:hypothetical protein
MSESQVTVRKSELLHRTSCFLHLSHILRSDVRTPTKHGTEASPSGPRFRLLKRGLRPRANYTYRTIAACQRSCDKFADRGCHVVSVTDPYGRILDFLGRSHYFSIK